MQLLDNGERPDEALRRYLRKCKARRMHHELNFRRALRKLKRSVAHPLLNELIKLQPMSEPQGTVFQLDYIYANAHQTPGSSQ